VSGFGGALQGMEIVAAARRVANTYSITSGLDESKIGVRDSAAH